MRNLRVLSRSRRLGLLPREYPSTLPFQGFTVRHGSGGTASAPKSSTGTGWRNRHAEFMNQLGAAGSDLTTDNATHRTVAST